MSASDTDIAMHAANTIREGMVMIQSSMTGGLDVVANDYVFTCEAGRATLFTIDSAIEFSSKSGLSFSTRSPKDCSDVAAAADLGVEISNCITRAVGKASQLTNNKNRLPRA